MNVGPPHQCVAMIECISIMLCVGHSHARPHGVARAQQGAQIRFERDPKGGNDEVIPTTMLASTTLPAELFGLAPDAGPAQRYGRKCLRWFMLLTLSSAAPDHLCLAT